MSLIGSVIGFGSFGFAARCFQLGLQKRGMFDGTFCNKRLVGAVPCIMCRAAARAIVSILYGALTIRAAPGGHLIATAVFGAIGYGVYEMEQRQYVVDTLHAHAHRESGVR